MAITGIRRLVYLVEDMEACVQFFTDYGLSLVEKAKDSARFEVLSGAEVLLLTRGHPKMPTSRQTGIGVLTPIGGMTLKTDRFQSAEGTIEFVESTWEQLPTMHNIVNMLASLPVIKVIGASLAMQRGAKDLSDQRPLG